MLRRYRPKSFTKIVADSGTPEFLAANNQRLVGATFVAEKAVGTPNATNIYLQIDGEDALILEPGEMFTWPQQPYEAAYWMPEDIKVRVLTNGDGVRCITNLLL